MNKNGIDLIPRYSGRLTAPGRLDVDGTEHEVDHIVRHGARPREMAFMPVDGQHGDPSRQALTLGHLPESMIAVGLGPSARKFGSGFTPRWASRSIPSTCPGHDAARRRGSVEDYGAHSATARGGADSRPRESREGQRRRSLVKWRSKAKGEQGTLLAFAARAVGRGYQPTSKTSARRVGRRRRA